MAAGDAITNQFIRKSTGSPRKRFINKTIRRRAPGGSPILAGGAASQGRARSQAFDLQDAAHHPSKVTLFLPPHKGSLLHAALWLQPGSLDSSPACCEGPSHLPLCVPMMLNPGPRCQALPKGALPEGPTSPSALSLHPQPLLLTRTHGVPLCSPGSEVSQPT